MHSRHTRYMLGFIRSLHGSVRFSYVPYVVHPSQHVAVPAPHPFIIRSYPLYVSFCTFIIRLSSVTICKILPNLAPYTNE